MQSVSTRIESFSTFKVSLPELDRVAISHQQFPSELTVSEWPDGAGHVGNVPRVFAILQDLPALGVAVWMRKALLQLRIAAGSESL